MKEGWILCSDGDERDFMHRVYHDEPIREDGEDRISMRQEINESEGIGAKPDFIWIEYEESYVEHNLWNCKIASMQKRYFSFYKGTDHEQQEEQQVRQEA